MCAESFVEGSQISDSCVESVLAHLEVVPEDVVFELGQRVSAGGECVTTVFGNQDPEGLEVGDGNGTVFVDFVVLGLHLLFLVIGVCEEFHSGIGLAVFLKDEKRTPFLEFYVRFFFLNINK